MYIHGIILIIIKGRACLQLVYIINIKYYLATGARLETGQLVLDLLSVALQRN